MELDDNVTFQELVALLKKQTPQQLGRFRDFMDNEITKSDEVNEHGIMPKSLKNTTGESS